MISRVLVKVSMNLASVMLVLTLKLADLRSCEARRSGLGEGRAAGTISERGGWTHGLTE